MLWISWEICLRNNMKFLFDLHTHTIASGHAYSTLKENMDEAVAKGLLAYGFSDHSEAVPGAFKNIYFMNFKVIPRRYKDMLILRGVEANIIDFKGNLDIEDSILKRLDYAIASLHTICRDPGTLQENMDAYFGVMSNPYVKIIGHPDDGRYPIDHDELAKEAKKRGIVLELNNSSLNPNSARLNGRENAIKLIEAAKKHGTSIICNTDSHFADYVGGFENCDLLLNQMDFPKELVLNNSMQKLKMVLNKNIDDM